MDAGRPANPYPQRKRLRLEALDYSEPGHVYFLTLRARHLSAPFSDPDLARAVVGALCHRSQDGQWRLYAYVVMPDHVHIAVSPLDGGPSIPELVKGFKSFTTRLGWNKGISGALWQRGYYDHVARREESLLAICEYILANPARKGLVSEVGMWPYAGMVDPLPLGQA